MDPATGRSTLRALSPASVPGPSYDTTGRPHCHRGSHGADCTVPIDVTVLGVNLDGDLNLGLGYYFKAVVEEAVLKEFKFTITASETLHLGVSTDLLRVSDLVNRTMQLGSDFSFGRFTIYVTVPFAPLPIPVVVTPILQLHAGIDGTIASLETGIRQSAGFTSGIEYRNERWSMIGEPELSFSVTRPRAVIHDVNFRAQAGPRLVIKLYEFLGPYGEVNGYFEFLGARNGSWSIYGGLDLNVGVLVEVSILGREFTFAEAGPFSVWNLQPELLAQWDPPPVVVDTPPEFVPSGVRDKTYTVGSRISQVTLPTATGGNGALSYDLTAPPAGLSFDRAGRKLSGTPESAGRYDMVYEVRDSDDNRSRGDSDRITFTIIVNEEDSRPEFVSDDVADLTYMVGSEIEKLTLPAANGGNGRLRYSLTPPPGLTFDRENRAVSGTPSTAGRYEVIYEVQDADDNRSRSDRDVIALAITINERDTPPVFVSDGVLDKTYYVGREIESFVLPGASGGNGNLRYSIDGAPPGLAFDSSNRTISGTPRNVGSYPIKYLVHDSDNNRSSSDSDLIQFAIKVEPNELCCTRQRDAGARSAR